MAWARAIFLENQSNGHAQIIPPVHDLRAAEGFLPLK